MIDNNSIELNETLLKHYGALARWTKEEAISLLSNLNPRCKKETLNIIKIAGDDILPMESLNRAIACGEISCVDGLIKPLDFVNLCKLKDLNFPLNLEVLVRKYHKSEEVDYKEEYKKLELENRELKEKVVKLEKNENPNAKLFKTANQIGMGMLGSKYNNVVENWEAWRRYKNNPLVNTTEKPKKFDLRFNIIEEDLRSLNAEGVKVTHDAIGNFIYNNIDLLKK